MSEFTQDDAPGAEASNKITEQKQGRFFVRESYLNEETNQVHWIVSPTDKSESQQEYSIIVPRDHPQMGTNVANLDGSIMDMTHIHIIKTERSPNIWQVHDATPTMKDADRRIVDKGESISTWTPDLSNKVEKYSEYRIFEKASEIKKDMYSSLNLMSEVKASTNDLFEKRAALMFPDVAPSEIKEFIEATSNPDSTHVNKTFNELMSGRQVDAKGQEERVFYHTEYPPSEQINMTGTKESAMSGLYNYCSQASAANMIKARITRATPDGNGLLEGHEKQLKKMSALVATHPTRTAEDYEILTREYAELIAGESIRGQMAACGAKSANPKFDDISESYNTALTGRGQDQTFGNEICRTIIKDFDAMKDPSVDPFLDYLNREKKHSYEFARTAKRGVEVAQDAAMAHGKERVPASKLIAGAKEVGSVLGGAGSGVISKTIEALEEMEMS